MGHPDRLATLGLLWAAWDRQGRVDYFGRAMLPLEEAASIGILEATVHLLDLQRALGVPPEVPAAGVEHTVGVLAAMAPPLDFIELATGRGSAALFPVLR